jgi:hypothetical protein
MILQNGEIGYSAKKYNCKFNDTIIEKIKSTFKEESRIICINLFTNEQLSYEIKSLAYSIIY